MLALGILGPCFYFAVVGSYTPQMQRRRQVRRFRKALADIDLMVVSWGETLYGRSPSDDVPDRRPGFRRSRRESWGERDGGAEPPL